MPSCSQYDSLFSYQKNLSRKLTPFSCPQCSLLVLPKAYETHCRTHHAFNPKRACVWCWGSVRWPAQQKYKHVDHLKQCWHRFYLCICVPAAVTVLPDSFSTLPFRPRPRRRIPSFNRVPPFDLTHPCPKRDALGHNTDSLPLDPFEEDLLHRLPLPSVPLTFQDAALNTAVACLRLYLALRDTVGGADWYHVRVRLPAYRSFVDLMKDADGRSYLLPFSCWCDGGSIEDPAYRQHRHCIVVSLGGHFQHEVWNRVQPTDWPWTNDPCKHAQPIQSPQHLAHAMGTVSQTASRCTFAERNEEEALERENHFYLTETLPKDYALPLFLQWDGGLKDFLDVRYNNMTGEDLALAEFHQNQWRFRIRDLPGLEQRGIVLPVSTGFWPCMHPTPYNVHLLDGYKLYFERDARLLGRRRTGEAAAGSWWWWWKEQAERGNLFYEAVGDAYWTPKPHYQGLIGRMRSEEAGREATVQEEVD